MKESLKVGLLGSNGSMGRRYKAILNFLGVSFVEYDPSLTRGKGDLTRFMSVPCTHYIIATPTDTHEEVAAALMQTEGRNLLIEKPVCTSSEDVRSLLEQAKDTSTTITVMMQYKYIDRSELQNAPTISYYNFYNTGKDGLLWDCFQVIAFDKTGVIKLYNDSPMWSCSINGYQLYQSSVDKAYVTFVRNWLAGNEVQSPEDIIKWHEKVEDLIRKRK